MRFKLWAISLGILTACANLAQAQVRPIVVNVHYGYNDQRPDDPVTDQVEQAELVALLTSSCPSSGSRAYTCGYTFREVGRVQELWRQFSNGAVVLIRTYTSSYLGSDLMNRGPMLNQQTEKSRVAREDFFASLERGERTVYIGHARYGGGPDFSPPRLRANGHTDVGFYQSNRASLRELEQRLPGSASPFLGIFACDSDAHFRATVQRSFRGRFHAVTGAHAPREMNRLFAIVLENELKTAVLNPTN